MRPSVPTLPRVTSMPNPAHSPWRRTFGQVEEADGGKAGEARLFLPLIKGIVSYP
ncbi:MAG: hypothetical protein MUO67_13785 [Anaerolineales bacterium]|nr:hypothetical protein [Anaerolineales bacterium]